MAVGVIFLGGCGGSFASKFDPPIVEEDIGAGREAGLGGGGGVREELDEFSAPPARRRRAEARAREPLIIVGNY